MTTLPPITPALMPTARRAELAFSHGEGAYLYGNDGKKYLDFLAGIAVCSLGHAHPHLVKELQDQATKVWHTSNLFRIPLQEKLADRLTKAANMDMAFFCNSGAEAVEAGFKLIRKYFDDMGKPEKYRVISVNQAFHGRTLATVSATGQEKYLKPFEPKVDGFDQVAWGNLNEMRAAIRPDTAAIIIEPIQGEGGIRKAPAEYLQALRKICDEFDLLLFFDEVQCGVGRSGSFCSHTHSGVEPDLIAVAKGLGGGFPIGALLAKKHAGEHLSPGSHGTTFGGSPLATRVANAVLDIMLAPGFLDNVKKRGIYFRDRLNQLKQKYPAIIDDVRGEGLICGAKLKIPNTDLVPILRQHQLLCTVGGDNVIRLLPPLIVTEKEIDEAISIIDQSCAAYKPAAA